MMIMTNDGLTIMQTGQCIHVSNGETYMLTGRTLVGPNGVISLCCSNIWEAVNIVIGMHGGRRF